GDRQRSCAGWARWAYLWGRGPRCRCCPHRPGELRFNGWREPRPTVKQPEQRPERGLRPAGQLRLELGEALDRPSVHDDPSFIEAELHRGLVRCEVALAPELPDRHDLVEGPIADQLEQAITCVRGRPRGRRRAGLGWTLELFAPAVGAIHRPGRLDCERGPAVFGSQADPDPARLEAPVRGVEVGVDLFGNPDLADWHEPSQAVRSQQPLTYGEVRNLVLQLDLHRARQAHARGSREPLPDPGRRGWLVTALWIRVRSFIAVNVSIVPSTPLRSSVRRQTASLPSCQERRSSASIVAITSAIRARASTSSTTTAASIRRSRLRSIRSADPMYHS